MTYANLIANHFNINYQFQTCVNRSTGWLNNDRPNNRKELQSHIRAHANIADMENNWSRFLLNHLMVYGGMIVGTFAVRRSIVYTWLSKYLPLAINSR